jgi:hypothetical protein
MGQHDIHLESLRLLEQAAALEVLAGQAVILANLENRPEVLDWYIVESLGYRLEKLLHQTSTLVKRASPTRADMEAIEAHLKEAERKLTAVREIADEIAKEAEGEEGAIIDPEDDQAMANRTFEAFVFIRNVLDRLAAAPSDSH